MQIPMPAGVSAKVLLVMLQMTIVSGVPPAFFYVATQRWPAVAAWGDWTKRAVLLGATVALALGFVAVTHVLTMETATYLISLVQSVLVVGVNTSVFRMGRTQPGNVA